MVRKNEYKGKKNSKLTKYQMNIIQNKIFGPVHMPNRSFKYSRIVFNSCFYVLISHNQTFAVDFSILLRHGGGVQTFPAQCTAEAGFMPGLHRKELLLSYTSIIPDVAYLGEATEVPQGETIEAGIQKYKPK